MKKEISRRRTMAALVAFVVVVALVFSLVVSSYAEEGDDKEMSSKYDNIDSNSLTAMGADPAELSVSSTTEYFEKEWYEYIIYNDTPVASYRVNDNCRIIYYDPYDYVGSMVMDVTYDSEDYSTANSISISHTYSTSYAYGDSETNTKSTATQHADGRDETGSEVTNSGNTTTEYNHSTDSKTDSHSVSETVGAEIGTEETVGVGVEITLAAKITADISVDDTDSSNKTSYTGSDTVTYDTKSNTTGWSEVADRITTTTGSSTSTNHSWSTSESTTITKTYSAAYFNASGSPLSWKIAYYEVKMPMRYELQLKDGNEWASIESGYCLLTTIKGSCRTWIEDGQVYYEHWGTGEPVADTEFWGDFFRSEDALKQAYQSRLYPN